jgi:hypothetical protein
MVTHHELGESSHNREEEYDERRQVETPPDLVETIRSLMEELQSCKVDNERLIKEQEKKLELMQSYCKSYQIYKGNYNMGQQPVMWIDITLRKTKVPLRYKSIVLKLTTQGGATSKFGSNFDGAFDAIATLYCRENDKHRTPSNIVSHDVTFLTT